MDRQKFVEEKTKKQSNRISLLLKYNRTLPNVKRAITNNWNSLHINQEFKGVFQELPFHINQEFKKVFQKLSFLPLKKNRNLYDLLGCKNVVAGKLQVNRRDICHRHFA